MLLLETSNANKNRKKVFHMLIHSQIVEFPGDGTSALGYLAHPKSEGPFPGIVVLQEWWGLDGHIQQVTERFAQEGFVALAPDLYRGQVATEPDEAQKLALELNRHHALKDVQGAVDYLVDHSQVKPNKVGVIGFCMGGGIAAMMSSQGQHLGAVAVFYGGRGNPKDPELSEAIKATAVPFLGIYGEKDESVPLDYVRWLDSKLGEFNKPHQIVIYPGAPHAFFNDTREAYRPEAAADAWQKTLTWFNQYLKV